MHSPFRFSHSVYGLAALVAVQWVLLRAVGAPMAGLTLLFALAGSVVTLYVATEVIERVREPKHMLVFLSGVVAEFVLFFACEYGFAVAASPTSFPTLPLDFSSLLLHSLMVFVFNPLYLPGSELGRYLLLLNSASALGLVLFVLQNIWQIRRA